MATLVAVFAVGSIGLAASSASACGGGYGKYGGYYKSYYPRYVERVYVKQPVVVSPTFAPAHSLVVVMPGDSWFSICSREYGTPNVWGQVAAFNGIPQNMQLAGGMQLRLPVIHPNGNFSLSSAPPAPAMAPQGIAGGFPQGMPAGMQFPQQGGQFGQPMQQFGQPMQQPGPQSPTAPQMPLAGASNIGAIRPIDSATVNNLLGLPTGQPAAQNAGPAVQQQLPSILIGSIMSINGQQLGENRGVVRLIVNGSPVALEILEWTATEAKVRIPAELPAGLQAQIEILRADGSVVAKDAVQLAAAPKVASTN
jgi:hypothetical protein